MFRLDFTKTPGSKLNGLLPADLTPGLIDTVTDHRCGYSVFVTGISKGKPPFDTGMTLIGLAVLIRCHTHNFSTACLYVECTANATIGTGRDRALLRQPHLDDRLLLKCRRGTTVDTGTAGNTLRFHEGFHLPGSDFRLETTTIHRQRKCTLYVIAGTYTAVTDDTHRRVKGEIRIGFIFGSLQVIATG